MSSESDKFVLEQALAQDDNDVFFQNKKWNYIVDATSNAGVFTNQIQFNLNTLASQGQWVNLNEAYIQFPIRVRIFNPTGSSQTPASAGVLSTVLKNGFHHMVDSVSIVLDNTNIQMNQNFENVNATFKILTQWDANTLTQLGPTLGLSALDDVPTMVLSVLSHSLYLTILHCIFYFSNGFFQTVRICVFLDFLKSLLHSILFVISFFKIIKKFFTSSFTCIVEP